MSLDKNLTGIRQISQEKLQSILCSIPSSQKDLIIEPSLIKPLEHVCGASWLRAKGINKIFKFDQENSPPKGSTMVYFITSKLIMFKHVLDQIQKRVEPTSPDHIGDDLINFHIIVVPNVLHSFEVLLEEMRLFGLVRLHRLNWDFINLDQNILSVEYPQMFREIFINDHYTLISSVAHSFRLFNMEGKNLKGMQLAEIQEYVTKKLPKVATQKKDLIKHLILCETIVNELGSQFEKIQTVEESMLFNRNKKQMYSQIQEVLSIDAHKFNALRHICLLHLTCGLTNDEATNFITNYLNSFGYQNMTIFPNLTNAGLFPEIENSTKTNLLPTLSLPKRQTTFQIEASKLKLLPEHATDTNKVPICPSYVFNGSYIPLVAQLTNVLLTAQNYEQFSAKTNSTEHLKLFKYFDRNKESIKDIAMAVKSGLVGDVFPLKPKTIFVFILGGLTYAEVAACQFVERMSGAKIVIGSNCMISGRDIVEASF